MKRLIISKFFGGPKSLLLAGMLVLGAGSTTGLLGSAAYLTTETGKPWGVGTEDPGSNEAAMDRVFGTSGWDNLSFENADASALFSAEYSFVFLEGGDNSALGLEAFLTANGGLIENWVSNGGRLFINAAPNEGSGMDLGFGLSLNYEINSELTHSYNGYAVDAGHEIFNGNYGETGGTFSGNWFSHATVEGSGLHSLITGDVGMVLGEMVYGDGAVLVGGMTLPHFHGPEQESYDLLANILDYAAHGTIPEPSTYAMWGAAGLLGVVLVRRRKSRIEN